MPTKQRPDPVIPDHEILRKIGGGAYGEVWLGRGVTGALRAIKVVWREDFEDERGFEREFEGILKFEPISRDHPGLVNILHVGRSTDGVSFYYYVMELGDDVRTGQDINPIEYEPRTLRADTRQAERPVMDTATCIDVGLRLAEALDHLHELGLAHRDVKPSNVIFVNGKAKLADIGLVAARGQRTFVGTEGFVPPEGPGSSQADVYSLGKVLYEIATGKDRLDFPELPDELPSGHDQKRWLELNRIICEICEPRLSKRTISTAAEVAEALRRLQKGKGRRKRRNLAVWLTTLLLLSFSGWAGYELLKEVEWQMPAPEASGTVKVISAPQGAEVFDREGRSLGTTPLDIAGLKVGETVHYTLKLRGYLPLTVSEKIQESAVEVPQTLGGKLQIYAPPEKGQPWMDHLGNSYQPVDSRHESAGFVPESLWRRFAEERKLEEKRAVFADHSENGRPVRIALAGEKDAAAFCRWLKAGAVREGYLTADYEVLPETDAGFPHPDEGFRPFRIVVREIDYGSIRVSTEPAGAEVYLNKTPVGSTLTELLVEKVKPGPVELRLVLEGYKPLTLNLALGEGQEMTLNRTLEENQGVVFGKNWENGIGMRFAPVGLDLMVSIWETRVSDYALYVRETGTPPPRVPEFPQEHDHPVVFVSRADAVGFTEWLTRRERRDERIAASHQYRLPTDLEWSEIAGLKDDPDVEPGARDARKRRVYPWTGGWPIPWKVGNYADATAALAPGMSADRTIPGYDDGFAYTAPVGSFPPNAAGIYDLSGNVEEWVSDDYSSLGRIPLGVLRGGGWNTYQRENLLTGARNAVPADFRDNIYGFRVVLAKLSQKEDNPLDLPETAEDETLLPDDG